MKTLCLTLLLASMLPTRLEEAVTVSTGMLHLSDLLAADAPAAIRDLAAPILLGHVPNPGSVRTLTREELLKALSAQPGLDRQLFIPPQISVTRASVAISEENIRAAIVSELRKQGWPDDALPRELLISQPATDDREAKLIVAAIKWDPHRHTLNFRLGCKNRESCASFLVRAPMPDLVKNPRMAVAIKPPLAAHAGDPALMTMRSGSLVMRIPVICLQRGAVGDIIRARDRSSRKIFRASVVSAGTLQALAN
jgi:hypothetical protein